jgi:membrane protease subunit HflC
MARIPWSSKTVKNSVLMIVAGLVLLALLSFSMAYTVRFTDAAVVTTFGRAGPEDVIDTPGLRLKWPYPIQSVTRYDTRLRVLSIKLEQVQTADNRQIAVEAYCTWRVKDPLTFFQKFSNVGDRAEDHYREAEKPLASNLRQAIGLVSRYTLGDLFSGVAGQPGAAPQASRMAQFEADMLASLRAAAVEDGANAGQAAAGLLAVYGIEVVDLGVTRVLLPEETSKSVFDRMKATREGEARAIESQGLAQAQAIRSKARADADRITAFAERLAQDIRVRGDLEAAPFLRQQNERADLAVFLRTVSFMEEVQSNAFTLVFSGDTPGMSVFDPGLLKGLKPGDIPQFKVPTDWGVDAQGRPLSTSSTSPATPAEEAR